MVAETGMMTMEMEGGGGGANMLTEVGRELEC